MKSRKMKTLLCSAMTAGLVMGSMVNATAVMAEELNMNVTTCALNGGEDYELLFTVPIGDHEKIEALEDVKLIGHITKREFGSILITRDNNEFELKAQGWNPLS